MTNYAGTSGDDNLPGSDNDTFDISQGGNDTVTIAGLDNVLAGGALTTADRFIGSGNFNLYLDGDYSAGLALSQAMIPDAHLLNLVLAAGRDYRLTIDGNFIHSNGNITRIDASALGAGNALTLALPQNASGGILRPTGFDVRGGAGTDTLILSEPLYNSGAFVEFRSTGFYVSTNYLAATVHDVERVQFSDALGRLGSGGNDTMGPEAGINAYFGGDGNDDITPNVGSVYIDGGNGQDWLYLSGAMADYTLATSLGALTVTKGGDVATLHSIEAVKFGDATLRLGDYTVNNMMGGAGQDGFLGGGDNDILNGGGGNDVAYYTGAQADYQVVRQPNGTYTVKDLRPSSPDGTDTLIDIETIHFSDASIAITPNRAPVVAASDKFAVPGTTLALSSLIAVSDANGDAITRYQLWDSTRDGTSGHFVVNGVAQAAGTVIDLTAAQAAQTSFVTGSVADHLQVRAFDGYLWSAGDTEAWSPFAVSPNHAPVVTTGTVAAAARNQTLALSSLFSVSDADGQAMTRYQLWDSTRDAASGYFVVNGVAQAAGTIIDITASQLAQTSFVTGSVGDSLQIRAFDGVEWSAGDTAAWAPFAVTVPNHEPVVTTHNVTAYLQQTIALADLFNVNDPDGDAITLYELWDSTRDLGSGHFVVNGVAQAAATVIRITAAQLAQTSYVTGSSTGDNLQIRAFDGRNWSAAETAAWSPFTVNLNTDEYAPVVTTHDVTRSANTSYALSSLMTVFDGESEEMTRYQLWDSSREATSGHFVVGGVARDPGAIIDITAAQLSQTSFLTGTTGDNLQVRAYNGHAWSASDSAAWSPFHIAVA